MQTTLSPKNIVESRRTELGGLRSSRRNQVIEKRRQLAVFDPDGESCYLDDSANPQDLNDLLGRLSQSSSLDQQLYLVKTISFIVRYRQKTITTADTIARIVDVMLPFLRVTNQNALLAYNVFVVFANLSSFQPPITNPLVSSGFIKILLFHLQTSENLDSIRMCLWCISNLLSEQAHCIVFLQHNLLGTATALLQRFGSLDAFNTQYAWFFCNLCRRFPADSVDALEPLVPVHVLATCHKIEPLVDILWGLFFLCSNPRSFDLFRRLGIFTIITPFLARDWHLQVVVLKMVSKYSSESDTFLFPFLQNNLLSYLVRLLKPTTKEEILHDVCFILGNFFTNEFLINTSLRAGVMAPLLSVALVASEFVRTETRWAVVNYLMTAQSNQMQYILQFDDLFRVLADFYVQNDRLINSYVVGILKLCLYIDEVILDPTEQQLLFQRLQSSGVVKCLERAADIPTDKTRDYVTTILRLYFNSGGVDI